MAEKTTWTNSQQSKKRDSSGISWSQVSSRIERAKARKNIKSTRSAAKENFRLSSSIAFQNGFYLHTYATNFAEALFKAEIDKSLQQIRDALDPLIEDIKDAVQPQDVDREAMNILIQPNEMRDAYSKLNKKLESVLTKLVTQNTGNSEGGAVFNTTVKDDDKLLAAVLEGKGISKPNDLGLEIVVKSSGKKKVTAGNIEEVAATCMLLYELASKIRSVVTNDKGEFTNKTYENAVNALDFVKILTGDLDDILAAQSGKSIAQKLGDYLEPAFVAIYGGRIVGDDAKLRKITASDVQMPIKLLVNENTMLEKDVEISLKRSSRIIRKQDLASMKSIIPEEELTNLLKPIKYFLANFTLIMEHQSDYDSENFQDTPIFSISDVVNTYNAVTNTIGLFTYTNMIVGYVLTNGNKNAAGQFEDLDKLPRIIYSISSKPVFTYDLLTSLTEMLDNGNQGSYGDMLMAYSAGLAQDYIAFTEAKKQVSGITSYEQLLENSNVRSLYDSISKEVANMSVWSAIDTARIINKTEVK